MKAHEAVSIIHDPHTSPTAALKVLKDRYEIIEHTERGGHIRDTCGNDN